MLELTIDARPCEDVNESAEGSHEVQRRFLFVVNIIIFA